MKNKKKFTSIIIMLMLLFQVTTASAVTTDPPTVITTTYTGIRVPNDYINQELTTKANTEIYNKFSDKAKEKLSLFNILILNKPLCEVSSLPQKYSVKGAYAGCTNYEYKEVMIDPQFYRPNNSGPLYHELGHCLDTDLQVNKPGLYSDTDQFKQVLNSEPKVLAYADAARNNYDIHEEFANLISFYLIAPDSFKIIAPKTFNYFESLGIRKQ